MAAAVCALSVSISLSLFLSFSLSVSVSVFLYFPPDTIFSHLSIIVPLVRLVLLLLIFYHRH